MKVALKPVLPPRLLPSVYYEQSCGRMTLVTVEKVRRWAEKILGVTSTLCMVRDGERNRVLLRFAFPSGIEECDAIALWGVHRSQPEIGLLHQRLREVFHPV